MITAPAWRSRAATVESAVRNAEFLRIETGAARRGKTRDIEAIFNRDGNAEKSWPLLRLRKAGVQGLGFRERAFLVHGQIHIAAGIAVGAGKRFAGQARPDPRVDRDFCSAVKADISVRVYHAREPAAKMI